MKAELKKQLEKIINATVNDKPKQAYELVCTYLQQQKLKIKKTFELAPFEKDHAAILITQ